MIMKQVVSLLVLLGMFTFACNTSGILSPAATEVQTAAVLMTQPPAATVHPPAVPTTQPAEHRIGVRVVDGVGEFYDRQTGETFIPRGNNFARLDWQAKRTGGQTYTFSTFNPGFYNHDEASQALAQMSALGYNVVRVFLDGNAIDGNGGPNGLSPKFMDNVADFLWLAKDNGIYVIFVKQWLPDSPRYSDIIARDCCETFGVSNAIHLAPAGVEAHRLFFQDLVRALIERGAPLDAIFSYNVSNEIYFDGDQPPLNWDSGVVLLGNGKSYDMSKPEDKQRMMDDGLVIIIDAVREAVLELDPTALVSVGFFQPQAPNPTRIGDARLIRTYAAIWESSADYIDLHTYPGGDLMLAQYVENYEMNDMQLKPIMIGEFGAFRFAFPDIEVAAQALVDWQVESCRYGFDGWLLWTWDDIGDSEMYTAVEADGVINQALAPANRPDPCAYGAGVVRNLALGARVRASGALPGEPPEQAVDGLSGTQWGAGASPPQWIEIELEAPARVSEIRLQVAQYPEGDTLHIIKARSADGNFVEVARISQFTRSEEWLMLKPAAPLDGVQVIRVETYTSPSWTAWKEIQIYGE